MKILITGSSGRIGRALSLRLSADHQVVGYDVVPSSTTDVVASLEESEQLRAAMDSIDAIVHTAALHAPHVGSRSDAEFDAVNVRATQALIRLALKARVRHVVYTSTTALYGDASTPPGKAGWITERTPPQPRTIYHRSKLLAEQQLEAAAQSAGLPVTVLRMSRCFPEPAPQMAVYRLHRGIDARDVADAHAAALTPFPHGFRRFIVSGTTPFEAGDVEELLLNAPAVLRRRAPELVDAFSRRGWELPASIDRVYDADKAHHELDWRAKYGFAEVLAQLDRRSSEVLPPNAPD